MSGHIRRGRAKRRVNAELLTWLWGLETWRLVALGVGALVSVLDHTRCRGSGQGLGFVESNNH